MLAGCSGGFSDAGCSPRIVTIDQQQLANGTLGPMNVDTTYRFRADITANSIHFYVLPAGGTKK